MRRGRSRRWVVWVGARVVAAVPEGRDPDVRRRRGPLGDGRPGGGVPRRQS